MFKIFLPNLFLKNAVALTPAYLQSKGVKGLITDLDNTLIRWDHPDATPELRAWFQSFLDEGIQVIVCSNNGEERVKRFADQVGLPYVFAARKPLTIGFKRALKIMGLTSQETAIMGDQLMTDVFGGNAGGFYTILVQPIAETDEWKTYLNRRMESVIMRYFRRKGMVEWKELI